MKKCTKCHNERELNQFSKRKQTKDGLQAWCKPCRKDYDRELYLRNPDSLRKIVKQNLANSKVRAKFIWEYKEANPCIDCGEGDPIVLEFDHRESSEKSHNISQMANGRFAMYKIINEIAKCDVRCSNCHRKRTAKQFNHHAWRNDPE